MTTTVTVNLVTPLISQRQHHQDNLCDSPQRSSSTQISISSGGDTWRIRLTSSKPRSIRSRAAHQRSCWRVEGSSHACRAFTTIPIILPKQAPTAMDGTKIPQGTLHPYEMMMKPIRMIVANRSELTIFHCSDDLLSAIAIHAEEISSLAQTIMITSTLAFSE
jgi:hypothetical protein